jgi:hypothetical protein
MHGRDRKWHHYINVSDLQLDDKYVFFKLPKHLTTLRLCRRHTVPHNEAPVFTKKENILYPTMKHLFLQRKKTYCTPQWSTCFYKEKFEDTKEVIRSCISNRDKQYNGQQKMKDKRTNRKRRKLIDQWPDL